MRQSIALAAIATACMACGSTAEAPTSGTEVPAGEPGGASAAAGQASPKDAPLALATDVAVDDVAVFQSLKVSIFERSDRQAFDLPIIAAKPALLRVYVKPSASFQPRTLRAVLRIEHQGKEPTLLEDERRITGPSTDADVDSTFAFDLSRETMTPDMKLSVALIDDSAAATTGESPARFPADGSTIAVGATHASGTLKVVLVPIRYDADGSGRLPDTSSAQLDEYRRALLQHFPTADVELSVREPVGVTSPIERTGNGFSSTLQDMITLRSQDGAADDVYYFGSVAPATSFRTYCGGACTTGLSGLLADERSARARASLGVGFTGERAARTMVHEIGHAHGRPHSPCNVSGSTDPSFPHVDGSIGRWGYDSFTQTMVDPSEMRDVMGYCEPSWISDYTYSKLFSRMQSVVARVSSKRAQNAVSAASAGMRTHYRFVDVQGDGSLAWGKRVELSEPFGDAVGVDYVDPSGETAHVLGHYIAYDHLPGGMMIVPEAPASAEVLRIADAHIVARPTELRIADSALLQ